MEINRYHLKSPVEITTTQLDIPQNYKQQCIDEIYRLGDSMNQETNVKAIMSSYKIWEETSLFNPLLDKISKLTNKFILLKDYKSELVECWSAIYKKSHYTIPHSHLPTHFSFVYYLKTNKNSSPLIFNNINFFIPPKEDMLILFPSYLLHSVPEQIYDEDRICLAGNFNFVSDK